MIAFVDDDVVPELDWVEQLVATYEERGVIAAVRKITPIWVDRKLDFLPKNSIGLLSSRIEDIQRNSA